MRSALTIESRIRLKKRGFYAVWLGLGLFGCGGSAPTTTQLVTAGNSPETLTSPSENLGGVVEVARVRFAGDRLSTRLLGDDAARLGDGQTLVVGAAGFAYPLSHVPQDAYAALPTGPSLRTGETFRCVIQSGPTKSPGDLPGVRVDVGSAVKLEGGKGALTLTLPRTNAVLAGTYAQSLRYYQLEPARTSADGWTEINWSNGTTLSTSMGGAALPSQRDYASLPLLAVADETLSLPLPLEGVNIGGRPVQLPTRDPVTGEVLESPPRFTLPTGEATLLITWQPPTKPETLTLVLEYFGAGVGRCPKDCGDASECCQTDEQCGIGETCEALQGDGSLACFAEEGTERLGALICTAEDSGTLALPGSRVDELNAQLSLSNALSKVRGAVLRIGRSVRVESPIQDVMTQDGTRHSLSPIQIRASDVVLTRFVPPAQEGG